MHLGKLNSTQRMLLGIAIGDAFGAGYEFSYKEVGLFKKNFDISTYRKNPNPKFQHYHPGTYTDDTQMSIAIAELLISGKPFNHQNLADTFVHCFKRDPIKGYAKGFQQFLESINSGEEFLEKIRPYSIRNGSAMRAVPLGVVRNIDDVITYATINAEMTHNNPRGIASSVTVSLLSHQQMYKKANLTHEDIISLVENTDSETAEHLKKISVMKEFDAPLIRGEKHQKLGIPCDALRTTGAVFYLLKRNLSPVNVLKEAILLGGDTDSVAAISLGITMINKSMTELPVHLYEQLNNHEFGRDYLITLGNQLKEKYIK